MALRHPNRPASLPFARRWEGIPLPRALYDKLFRWDYLDGLKGVLDEPTGQRPPVGGKPPLHQHDAPLHFNNDIHGG